MLDLRRRQFITLLLGGAAQTLVNQSKLVCADLCRFGFVHESLVRQVLGATSEGGRMSLRA
jgi:hypothetical protein